MDQETLEALVKSLFALIAQGNLQGVGDLLKVNPNLAFSTNPEGTSPVLFAVYCGRAPLAKTIAALRATPLSPFEAAALGEKIQLTRSAERAPEIVNSFAQDGFSLLHLAAFFGHPDCVAILLERGANPNACSKNDAHLHVINSAAAQKDPEKAARTCRLLLEAGADPNAAQKGGYTAAHSAAANGNLDLLKLLASRKAPLDRKTEDGKTPLDVARERDQPAAVAFLQAGNK